MIAGISEFSVMSTSLILRTVSHTMKNGNVLFCLSALPRGHFQNFVLLLLYIEPSHQVIYPIYYGASSKPWLIRMVATGRTFCVKSLRHF